MGGADLKIMIQFFLSNYDIVFKCLSGKQRHFQKLQIIKVFLKSNNQKVREIVEALKNADFVKMKICNIFFFIFTSEKDATIHKQNIGFINFPNSGLDRENKFAFASPFIQQHTDPSVFNGYVYV